MPRKVSADSDFIEWWHKNHFYSNPLFEIYEELHSKKVDLNYLEFARKVLSWMDGNVTGWRGELKAKKPNGRVAQFDGMPGPLTKLLSRPSLLIEQRPWDKPGLKYGDKLKAKRLHRIAINESVLTDIESDCSPFVHLIIKYMFESARYGTGSRSDRRGDLILTALVEQFRRTIQKPLWQHAGQLLDAFRSVNGTTGLDRKTKSRPHLLRKKTEARVRKFKQFNPHWRGEARLIILEYYRK